VIKKNKVVSIAYCLKNTKGEELDQAGADKPLEYLHGCGNIVPGLENALDGLKVGNKKDVTVKPEDGYGEILTDLKMEVERQAFPTDQKIDPGMQFMGELKDGKKHPFNVVEVKDGKVRVDGNHPLAGQTLQFSVEIIKIRDATSEELKHGHAHGEGGHHH
jgi:FKBP-type peptidyl-prolyl cis-trans isomerase SlyD